MFQKKYIKYKITEQGAKNWKKEIINSISQSINSLTLEQIDGIMNLKDRVQLTIGGTIETSCSVKETK